MGSGHCGSTLMDLIIGSHSQAFSLGEFNHISQLISRECNGGVLRICGVCEGECSFWNHKASERVLKLLFLRTGITRNFMARLSRLVISPYSYLFEWSGKGVLVDSSKRVGWITRQLVPAYKWRNMTPYLIYMVRDGRAVVNSYFRKYPERGFENIAEHWKQQVLAMNEFYKQFPQDRKIIIHYEVLASQPESVAKDICNFVGIEYEKEMLNYWIPEHHHVCGNAGTRSLIYKYREQFGCRMTGDKQEKEQEEAYYGDSFYNNLELAIKLDQRWVNELRTEQLVAFEQIAGDINRSLIANPGKY